jgi:hypothetical protein
VSAENRDGLLDFYLQLARWNDVVSADCIQCENSLYICIKYSGNNYFLILQSNVQRAVKFGICILPYSAGGFDSSQYSYFELRRHDTV